MFFIFDFLKISFKGSHNNCNSLAKKELIPKLYFLALTDSIMF